MPRFRDRDKGPVCTPFLPFPLSYDYFYLTFSFFKVLLETNLTLGSSLVDPWLILDYNGL